MGSFAPDRASARCPEATKLAVTGLILSLLLPQARRDHYGRDLRLLRGAG